MEAGLQRLSSTAQQPIIPQAIFLRNGIPFTHTFEQFPVTGKVLRQLSQKYALDMPKCSMEISIVARAYSLSRWRLESPASAGTHLRPHCGPTNHRLRLHLGLVVPENSVMISGGESRHWEEGKVLVLDDSFEHEA